MNGRHAGGGLSALDAVAIGVAALVVALEAGLWLWAGAAGALFGSGWPHMGLSVLWPAIAGVAGHLSDPRQGFPARLRPGLPGPTGFYLPGALTARSRSSLRRRSRFAAALARVVWATPSAMAPAGLAPAISPDCIARAADARRRRPPPRTYGRRRVRCGDCRSATGGGGCCAPRTATRWSCSDRRSRASRPGSRSRTSSSGQDQRSSSRSNPTCSTPP